MKARSIVLIIVAIVVMAVAIVPVWSALSSTLFPSPSDNVDFAEYNPYASGGTWYKGQLHSHSTRSDGELAPSDVVARYASFGYKFIAISDHHTVTKIKGGSVLVLGQEYGKGSTESGLQYNPHMNGINISSAPSEDLPQQKRIDSITSQSGIVVLNHPTMFMFSYDLNDLKELRNYTAIEIYNGYSDGFLSGDAVSLWDDILSTGRVVWGTAGDDAHTSATYDKGWIEVRLSGKLTTANVINAIKRGSFYSTQGPMFDELRFNGTTFTVSSPDAHCISFYGRDGRLLETVNGGYANYTVKGNEGYVRAEVSADGLKAWSQPVFVGKSSTSVSGNTVSDIGPSFATRTWEPVWI
ncbi:MAG: CehA/McbA family metallohydrolase [Methanomassiliicoccus sp.]|nr:CehA/McbA family metallohydrolase [Methanomassiliicoccus sp.]